MLTPRPNPFARPRLLAGLLLAALVLAGCGPAEIGPPTSAATVNGEQIPVETVQRRFDSVKDRPELAQQLAGDATGEFRRRVQAQILSQLIRAKLMEQGAETLGVEVTDADVAEERARIVQEVGGQDAFDRIVEENRLTEREIVEQLRELAVERRVDEALTAGIEVSDAEVRAAYEQAREVRFDRVRASHLLVETREQAEAAKARVAAGEDFAAVAQDVSLDAGSAAQGGDLGFFTRGRLVPEFEQAAFGAEPGEIVGPIETDFGWHVIEVTDRETQSLEEVRDDLRTELVEQHRAEARSTWQAEHNLGAEITVNPRFGSWDVESGQVVTGDPLGETREVDGATGGFQLAPQDQVRE